VTDLARLDGPGAAALSDQLVGVYRAAMGPAPSTAPWASRSSATAPFGWHDADRVVLGAELPPPGS
jgi:hypothetical protein